MLRFHVEDSIELNNHKKGKEQNDEIIEKLLSKQDHESSKFER